jgi:hypothetical protein
MQEEEEEEEEEEVEVVVVVEEAEVLPLIYWHQVAIAAQRVARVVQRLWVAARGWGGGGGRELLDDAREDVLMHRKSLWDETGAPAERNVHDLKALRKTVEDAREARDDERMRDVTLRYA